MAAREAAVTAQVKDLGHPSAVKTLGHTRARALGHTRVAQVFDLCLIVLLAAPAAAAPAPSRIVSVVPAVTEMLFAMGAGRQVAGVGSFVTYPPEVKDLPRVGGLLDPDLERILSLRPDLVVVYDTQTDLKQQLARAGIPTYDYTHRGLADIFSTLRAIGARVGRAAAAERVASGVEARIDAIRRRVAGRPRPRTLVVFARDRLALRNIYASGGVGFVNDMLEAAGGENVFADVKQQAVQASSELVLARAPDVILELRGDFETIPVQDRERERHVWDALSSVPAVRNGRIDILVSSSLVVPGPRVADGIELIARALHPGAFTSPRR
jgi:iron complex transport system substrate-binding protein